MAAAGIKYGRLYFYKGFGLQYERANMEQAKRTAARIAVAEVQRQHAVWSMAQLRFEVHRALPVLPRGADGEAVVTEVAKLAVSAKGASMYCWLTSTRRQPAIPATSARRTRSASGTPACSDR